MKKHYRQMSNQERYIVKRRISMLRKFALSKYQFSRHASIRMKQRSISGREIFKIFSDYQLVECRWVDDDIRAVISSRHKHNNNNTLVSVSLVSGRLITCYEVNSNKLRHVNLDKYDTNIEIIELLQKYIYNIA